MSIDGMDLHRIVRELVEIKAGSGKRVLDLRDAEARRNATVREYEKACALVRLRAQGSVQHKQDCALVDEHCDRLRAAMDAAKEGESYAKASSRQFDSDQSNLQTQARLVEQAMRLAGVGER